MEAKPPVSILNGWPFREMCPIPDAGAARHERACNNVHEGGVPYFANVIQLLHMSSLLSADMALPHLLQMCHPEESLHLCQAYRAVKHHDLNGTMSLSQLEWCSQSSYVGVTINNHEPTEYHVTRSLLARQHSDCSPC